jgi:hypothetical protein
VPLLGPSLAVAVLPEPMMPVETAFKNVESSVDPVAGVGEAENPLGAIMVPPAPPDVVAEPLGAATAAGNVANCTVDPAS